MATAQGGTESQFDGELAEELSHLETYSHNDYVEVKIGPVGYPDDRTATVEFHPPVGESFEKEMEVPVDPSTTTEFTKLLDEMGQNFDTASKMVGDRVPAKFTEDGWEIQYSPTTKEQVRNLIRNIGIGLAVFGGIVYWPVSGVIAVVAAYRSWVIDEGFDEPSERFISGVVLVILYMVGTLVWSIFFMLIHASMEYVGFQLPVGVLLGL